jgi:hypothetical protein
VTSVSTYVDNRKIADRYHSWRGDKPAKGGATLPAFAPVAGFSAGATIVEIGTNHSLVLTPGYLLAPEVEGDGVSFEIKLAALTGELATPRLRRRPNEYIQIDRLIDDRWPGPAAPSCCRLSERDYGQRNALFGPPPHGGHMVTDHLGAWQPDSSYAYAPCERSPPTSPC